MNNSVNKIKDVAKKIKIRLDRRTILTLSSAKSLDFWKTRYPDLEILPY